ncbi:Hypothetical predicted protein [Pelobates cultripes]|uniref:Uncharacterized protein n=1 Tax=Pelobates cultripes TaxID=61616 RepID=A0AAD1WTC0_PELCU|nr:Hypothetical predicted protein [Pelobates cultripes]
MSQRQKAKAAKADRASFFLVKPATALTRKGRSPTKDGGDTRSEEEPPPSPEKWMDEFVKAHNSLADKLQEIDSTLHDQALKRADMEDRSRHNNLRIRGIPESVLNPALHNYLLDMFQALTPETHPDQLIIDWAHRLRRPKHLPNSTARDVIVRVHFYHAREVVRALPRPKNLYGLVGGNPTVPQKPDTSHDHIALTRDCIPLGLPGKAINSLLGRTACCGLIVSGQGEIQKLGPRGN